MKIVSVLRAPFVRSCSIAILSVCLLMPAYGQSSSRKDSRTEGAGFVRRFSLGLTLSVLGQYPVRGTNLTQEVSSTLIIDSSTKPTSRRPAPGVVFQLALPNQLALAANVFLRRTSHTTVKDTTLGTDNVNTSADERVFTTETEDTRARLLDLAFLVRRYNKDHSTSGSRWFFEAGPVFRNAAQVRTWIETISDDDTTTCCTTVPHALAAKWATGISAGIGGQFTDDFGIRLVPEFRYTRWMQKNFDSLSARSRADQLEGMISITF